MKAGPLAERPVTASMCFSSTTTVRPTTRNRALAFSTSPALAYRPRQRAVMPTPRTQGVLGMARTTGTSTPRADSIWAVGTDAATEMISWLRCTFGRICSITSCTTCGLTHTKIMSAWWTAARLSVLTGMRSLSLRAQARSSWATVAQVSVGCRRFFSSKALSRMPPILPAPRTTTRCVEKSMLMKGPPEYHRAAVESGYGMPSPGKTMDSNADCRPLKGTPGCGARTPCRLAGLTNYAARRLWVRAWVPRFARSTDEGPLLRGPVETLFRHMGDSAPDGERGGGGGRRDVVEMEHVAGGAELEVVDHRSIGAQRLGAYSGAVANQISFLDFGQQLLHGPDEGAFVERAIELSHCVAPVFGGHVPEPGIGEGFDGVAQAEVGETITFALEGEHGVRAGIEAAGDAAREVRAQERELRVGHRINETPHQVVLLRDDVVVLTAEGHDHGIG